jgi:hypothetical protein
VSTKAGGLQGAAGQLANLLDKTVAFVDGSLKPALRQHLVNALAQLSANHAQATCGLLNAYSAIVGHAPVKNLSPAERAELLADAARITAVLDC